tara:strand:- start:1233 stop:1406 length:174 start_codon:yes stop_codon:yes gene_type:complete
MTIKKAATVLVAFIYGFLFCVIMMWGAIILLEFTFQPGVLKWATFEFLYNIGDYFDK